jgi:hypothetical protein
MIRLLLILIFSHLVYLVSGQNNTNSPYSVFGIGELEQAEGGRNMGMGGTGTALRSDLFLNLSNPASLTSIPARSLATDAGINFRLSNLKNLSKSANVLNGNISWAAIAFPINRTFAAGFSLNPKSSVGYTIYSTKSLEGTAYNYPVTYKGEGGLSELSASLGALITKKFSLGLKSSLLWGNIVKTTEDTPPIGSSITRIDNTNYAGISLKPGFQYQSRLSKNTIFTLGGIAEISSYLNGSSTINITSGSETVLSTIDKGSQIRLPSRQGLGMALGFKSRYLLTFDYNRSDWRDAELNLSSKRLCINNSYHLGVEIAPKYDPERMRQTNRYRIGAFYQTGYLNIYGTQISSYAATCGVSFPMKKDRNSFNLSLEAGRQGTLDSQLIKETYLKLNLSFNLWEHWFIPRKYD